LEQVSIIRKQQYTVEWEQCEEGLKGVAFLIWNGQNQLAAALCIAGVSYRFTDEKIENIRGEAANIARTISAQLGFKKIVNG
jgi:IclR family transcriptional regulator, KDG regulon repressor